jgi:putative phosphoesterase
VRSLHANLGDAVYHEIRHMILGILSDTHGLLRSQALDLLRGSDHILHAGDIGAPEILAQLAKVAPVTAVRGNIDKGAWAQELPLREVFEADGVSLYLLHKITDLDLKPEAAGFAAVIYGHSHIPKIETRNGVLYLNPGSAGPRRFKLPVTLGKLVVENGSVRAEIVQLAN